MSPYCFKKIKIFSMFRDFRLQAIDLLMPWTALKILEILRWKYEAMGDYQFDSLFLLGSMIGLYFLMKFHLGLGSAWQVIRRSRIAVHFYTCAYIRFLAVILAKDYVLLCDLILFAAVGFPLWQEMKTLHREYSPAKIKKLEKTAPKDHFDEW